MKELLIFSLFLIGIVALAFSSQQKNPTAYEYVRLKKKVAMLERQIGIMQDGWSGCLQEYENLMNDCKGACANSL